MRWRDTRLATWFRWPRARDADDGWSSKFVPLALVADGERVRVRVRILPPQRPIYAPLSHRPCVLWELTFDESVMIQRPQGYRSRSQAYWRSRVHDAQAMPFDVEDDSGRASIDVRGIISCAQHDVVRKEPWICAPDVRFAELLTRYDTSDAPIRQLRGRLRIREGIFAPGSELVIQGSGRWADVPTSLDAGYRDMAHTRRLVIGPDDVEPVYASNDPSEPY